MEIYPRKSSRLLLYSNGGWNHFIVKTKIFLLLQSQTNLKFFIIDSRLCVIFIAVSYIGNNWYKHFSIHKHEIFLATNL